MRIRVIAPTCAAAVLTIAVVASGQATSQTPSSAPVQSGSQQPGPAGSTATDPRPGASTAGARTDTNQRPGTQTRAASAASPMTFTGCVERGSGGELVLVTATADDHTSGEPSTRATDRVDPTTPATTTGSRAGTAPPAAASAHDVRSYRLMGEDVSKYVGQRVEITGTTAWVRGAAAGAAPPGDPQASACAPARDRDRDAATARVEHQDTTTGTTGTTGPSQQAGTVQSAAKAGTAQALVVTSVKAAGGGCR
jgi:hypothetical protein